MPTAMLDQLSDLPTLPVMSVTLLLCPVVLASALSASTELSLGPVCLPGGVSTAGAYTLSSVVAQPTTCGLQSAGSAQLAPGFLGVERGDLFRIGDINRDGNVNGIDLGYLLADWGTALLRTDLNRDGFVDGLDLGILLAEWG
jgi:hypothetical protein